MQTPSGSQTQPETATTQAQPVTGTPVKPVDPVKPWGAKDFLMGIGYPAHSLEGYVPYPESLLLTSMPPPTERTGEDQPFVFVW